RGRILAWAAHHCTHSGRSLCHGPGPDGRAAGGSARDHLGAGQSGPVYEYCRGAATGLTPLFTERCPEFGWYPGHSPALCGWATPRRDIPESTHHGRGDRVTSGHRDGGHPGRWHTVWLAWHHPGCARHGCPASCLAPLAPRLAGHLGIPSVL